MVVDGGAVGWDVIGVAAVVVAVVEAVAVVVDTASDVTGVVVVTGFEADELQAAPRRRRATRTTGRGPLCRCTSFTPEGRNAVAHLTLCWNASAAGLSSTCCLRDTAAHRPGGQIGCERRLDSSAATLTSSNLGTRPTADFPGTVWRATRLRRDNNHGRSLVPGEHSLCSHPKRLTAVKSRSRTPGVGAR